MISNGADNEADYLALAQRTQADFENYRKRATREIAEAQQKGKVSLLRELLPALDNFARASEAVSDADATLVGLKMAEHELEEALIRVGIERFANTGDVFDPQIHEAVLQQPSDFESGTIIAVLSHGYRCGDAVVRPATVVVAGHQGRENE